MTMAFDTVSRNKHKIQPFISCEWLWPTDMENELFEASDKKGEDSDMSGEWWNRYGSLQWKSE